MWFKLIAMALLVIISINLFLALASLVKGDGDSSKTAKRLGYRVAFSVLLLLFLGMAAMMGWITPHGVNPSSGAELMTPAALVTLS